MTEETRQPDPTDPAAEPATRSQQAADPALENEGAAPASAAGTYAPYDPPADVPALDAGDENPDALVGSITSSDVDLSHLEVVQDTDGGDSDA